MTYYQLSIFSKIIIDHQSAPYLVGWCSHCFTLDHTTYSLVIITHIVLLLLCRGGSHWQSSYCRFTLPPASQQVKNKFSIIKLFVDACYLSGTSRGSKLMLKRAQRLLTQTMFLRKSTFKSSGMPASTPQGDMLSTLQ